MKEYSEVKQLFEKYNGMMRTYQLSAEKIYYNDIQDMVREGLVEKVRYGYYQWIDENDGSEALTVIRLFPDAILCMYTALRYYGYSDRTPIEWHLAVSKDSNKSRFNIDYPFIKPYYVEKSILSLGMTEGRMDGHIVKIYDKERVICDCLRYRNKMDREIFNKAIQSYVQDTEKNIPRLMEYAHLLRIAKTAKNLIGVWL
jgi:predicted transcriptional regulator of viral defense system